MVYNKGESLMNMISLKNKLGINYCMVLYFFKLKLNDRLQSRFTVHNFQYIYSDPEIFKLNIEIVVFCNTAKQFTNHELQECFQNILYERSQESFKSQLLSRIF